jgi:hypothetical protein
VAGPLLLYEASRQRSGQPREQKQNTWVLRSAQDEGENKQRQQQQQIPSGDDNQKGKCNRTGNSKGNSKGNRKGNE